ncbi:MAG: site-specific integrase [Pseudomonas sp.]|nr:MAG: site-specific integrase [Pseudomonas sp.]
MAVETVRLLSGERLPILLDEEGLPIVGPCEWILSRRHLAYNTLSRNANELAVMNGWLQKRRIDLFERLRSAKRFSEAEINSLIEHLRRPQQLTDKVSKLAVTPDTANKRISTVAAYLAWSFEVVITTGGLSETKREVIKENYLSAMNSLLDGRQKTDPPTKKQKRLTDQEAKFLQDILDPDGQSDFGRDRTVKLRNFLAVCILLWLGLRPGELLGLRVHDVEFGAITSIRVVRRGMSLADPRSRPAMVKRAGRVLPLDSPRLAQLLDDYIMDHRERSFRHGKAAPHAFLFVSDDGAPLSSDSLQQLFKELRQRYPKSLPPHLTAKALRHTFSDNVYRELHSQGVSEDEITKILMELRGDTAPGSQDTYIDYRAAAEDALRRYHLKIASSGSVADVPF